MLIVKIILLTAGLFMFSSKLAGLELSWPLVFAPLALAGWEAIWWAIKLMALLVLWAGAAMVAGYFLITDRFRARPA